MIHSDCTRCSRNMCFCRYRAVFRGKQGQSCDAAVTGLDRRNVPRTAGGLAYRRLGQLRSPASLPGSRHLNLRPEVELQCHLPSPLYGTVHINSNETWATDYVYVLPFCRLGPPTSKWPEWKQQKYLIFAESNVTVGSQRIKIIQEFFFLLPNSLILCTEGHKSAILNLTQPKQRFRK